MNQSVETEWLEGVEVRQESRYDQLLLRVEREEETELW